MSSITLTLTGETSSLSSYFYPEIELDGESGYSCCLLDFFSYNSIPNINEKNNKFYYVVSKNSKNFPVDLNQGDENSEKFYYTVDEHLENVPFEFVEDQDEITKVAVVPVGAYEIDEIITFLNNEFEKQKLKIKITADKNTMKCSINSELA